MALTLLDLIDEEIRLRVTRCEEKGLCFISLQHLLPGEGIRLSSSDIILLVENKTVTVHKRY